MGRIHDWPREELEAALRRVLDLIEAWRDGRDASPPLRRPDPGALRSALDRRVPREGRPVEALLEEFKEVALPHLRRNDHPRFFGFVQSGGSDAGAVADFLASALNQNVTAWRSTPAAAEMERTVVGWLAEIAGMPEGTAGLLLGGGSSANLTALAAARDAMAGADVGAAGLIVLGREMTLYASDEVHMSVPRAASLLGLGRDQLRIIPSDERYRIDLRELRSRIAADRAEGRLPFCVVAQGGSTNTGAVDPIGEVARLCRDESLWLHVDAAYGGFAVLAKDAPRELREMSLADSVTIDPHKWLHLPIGCGALLVKEPSALRAPFGEVGAYARTSEQDERASFAFFEHGPELSRPFRALAAWMVIGALGTEGIAGMVGRDLALARSLARRIEASPDLELLAPVPLGAVCFRASPRGADEGEKEALNRRILAELHAGGAVYPTSTEIKGRFALRACVMNPRTSESDVALLVEEVRRIAAAARP